MRYIREEVSKAEFANYLNEEGGALLELSTALRHKSDDFLGLLAKHQLFAQTGLRQEDGENYQGLDNAELDAEFDTSARTEGEIGTGHIDNEKGELGLNGYEYTDENGVFFIHKLVGYLDELIAEIEAENQSLEQNEATLGMAFIKFRDEIERENHVLKLQIEQWQAYIVKLQAIIKKNKSAHQQCIREQTALETNLNSIKAEYSEATIAYNDRSNKMANTIAVIEKAIEIYTNKVSSASSEYKERVKDYTEDENKEFDKTDFENRSTNEEIENFNPTAGVGEEFVEVKKGRKMPAMPN